MFSFMKDTPTAKEVKGKFPSIFWEVTLCIKFFETLIVLTTVLSSLYHECYSLAKQIEVLIRGTCMVLNGILQTNGKTQELVKQGCGKKVQYQECNFLSPESPVPLGTRGLSTRKKWLWQRDVIGLS